MKAEYDFSKGERSKFYSPDAVFSFPVYLEPDVSDFMNQYSGFNKIALYLGGTLKVLDGTRLMRRVFCWVETITGLISTRH